MHTAVLPIFLCSLCLKAHGLHNEMSIMPSTIVYCVPGISVWNDKEIPSLGFDMMRYDHTKIQSWCWSEGVVVVMVNVYFHKCKNTVSAGTFNFLTSGYALFNSMRGLIHK